MDIQQEIMTLKDQGVTDKDIVELLILKGREKDLIEIQLKNYYHSKNATPLYEEKTKSIDIVLLGIISLLLLIIAFILGYFIIKG